MNTIEIVDKFPEAEEFYKTYWGRKPFIVRDAINHHTLDNLIDGDSLAGLALEDDIKSRIVITEDNNKWTCHHGAFDEDKFATLGERNWSLLVQNVDQYHTDTAKLLKAFNFSPRWLMDDIMVSYSTIGGNVGPHFDSYHVFLVQGMGKRKWKVGRAPIENVEYSDNADLLVLKDGFEGDETEVSIGDVIYIPPYFGHQGITTTKEAMTFSVGFLGPKLSEIMSEYSYYLEQNPDHNTRYTGQGLDVRSAAFLIDPSATNSLRHDLISTIQSNNFSAWMAEYFSVSTHDEYGNEDAEQNQISEEKLLDFLRDGEFLCRPEYIKIAMTTAANGSTNLAIYGEIITIPTAHNTLITWLNNNHRISLNDLHDNELLALVTQLYNKGILLIT
jgi:50S ribosomal protein L16 3-hydroxylase